MGKSWGHVFCFCWSVGGDLLVPKVEREYYGEEDRKVMLHSPPPLFA